MYTLVTSSYHINSEIGNITTMSLLCYHCFFCPCWEHVASTCFYCVGIWWKSQTVMWVRKCHNWKCQFFGWTISFKGKRTFFFLSLVRFVSKKCFVRFVSKILNPATFDFFTSSVNKRIQLSSAESTGLPRACFYGCGCCIFILYYFT